MTRKERYNAIIGWFQENQPMATSELHFENPYQLLVAVILSAQCTDKRVNMVTPPLFERFPAPEDLASATFDDVYPYVKSVSYPNAKARHLIAMAQMLVNEYGSEVPSDIDALMRMPGVGRKTANVIASVVYDQPVIAVDTHVFRVAHRLGLSDGSTPRAVELDLERHIAPSLRPVAHHWLILHGRYTCTARSPKCADCPLFAWCKEYPVLQAGKPSAK
ncbi:MAG: endonuclease III [Bacteroidales bacterium]|nr:endonuclease III [Bacteroidales bacterium]